MVKNIHIQVSDEEHQDLKDAKSGELTWKELLYKGKQKVEG